MGCSLRVTIENKLHEFIRSEYINYNAIYIQLGIQRCDGPERHRMLTIINAYYGYY